MRTIEAETITSTVRRLCMEANYNLPRDVQKALKAARAREDWPGAQGILDDILQNVQVAKEDSLPLCQDTGMACVFVEVGQQLHVGGVGLEQAINEGVRQGYRDGLLRKSVVADPLRRQNTGDNTPAVIHTEIVDGDALKITVAPKGFGSENMSRIKMCAPSEGVAGVIGFVLETVELAGSNPCPPIILGVGLGGSFEKAALLAKKALLRPVDSQHPDAFYAKLEETLLAEVNALGIGPQGFGGHTTALGVNIESYPTHIASLPVAVNVSCHVTRHAAAVL